MTTPKEFKNIVFRTQADIKIEYNPETQGLNALRHSFESCVQDFFLSSDGRLKGTDARVIAIPLNYEYPTPELQAHATYISEELDALTPAVVALTQYWIEKNTQPIEPVEPIE